MAMFVVAAIRCQLSLQKHRFSSMVFQVGFEMKNVALGQASLRECFIFTLPINIPPVHHSHLLSATGITEHSTKVLVLPTSATKAEQM
jgi:hypothetical protein